MIILRLRFNFIFILNTIFGWCWWTDYVWKYSRFKNNGSPGFAVIKGFLTNGNNNTTGDIFVATRPGNADSSLTNCLRIIANGDIVTYDIVYLGTAAQPEDYVSTISQGGLRYFITSNQPANAKVECKQNWRGDSTGSVAFEFSGDTSSTNGTAAHRGSITVTNTQVFYNTTSDYRLKENVVPMTGSIDRVKNLSPCRFNFISVPEQTVDGFLAHEVQSIVPESITGTHNEVQVWSDEDEELPEGVSIGDNKLDDEGNTIPVMQNIDHAKLVPVLTSALKETIAKVETLETKVAALEGN